MTRGQACLINVMLNLFQHLFIRYKDVKRQRCEANLEGRKLRRYEGRLLTLTNPFLPLLGKDKRMGNNQYPPQLYLTRFAINFPLTNDTQSFVRQSHPLQSERSLIREGAACHCERLNGASQSQDSEMLKQVQHDVFSFVKRTYRPNVLSSYRLKKSAFTLAEVLITLGIIGVVAALTIPNLIAEHKLKVLHTQFLKTYSDLNNVAKRFEYENDMTVYDYDLSGNHSSTDVLKKILSYFIGKEDGMRIYSDYDENTEGNSSFENATGYTPKNLAGKKVKIQPCDQSIIIKEVGGRFFSMDDSISKYENPPQYGPKICVDINGSKGPNIYGYDWFVFVFTKEGGIKPYIGNDAANVTSEITNPERACNYNYADVTYTCGYFALLNKSPENPNETYWKDFLK